MTDTTKASMTNNRFNATEAILTQGEIDFYMKRGRKMRAEAAAQFSSDVGALVKRGFEALPALWSRLLPVGRPQQINR